jgi:hypothetical protein
MHITQDDCEDSLNSKNKIPISESNKEVFSFVQYRMFVDALQADMHMKCDLRPRKKETKQDS